MLYRLFAEIDRDNDNYISRSELRKLIVDIKFRNMPVDADDVVEKIMEELDINEDEMINEEEFIAGFSKWVNASNNNAPHLPESEDEIYQVNAFLI